MNQVFELSRQLNKALLESTEYQQYVNSSKAVKQQPELYQMMNDYRRRNRHVQMYASDDTIFDETNQLLVEYDTVLKNELVAEFLAAEQKLLRMLQEIYLQIDDQLEFDDSFMEG